MNKIREVIKHATISMDALEKILADNKIETWIDFKEITEFFTYLLGYIACMEKRQP